MTRLPSLWMLVALTLFLGACSSDGDTESDVPADGDTLAAADGDAESTAADGEDTEAESDLSPFVVAILADPHFIDDAYVGPESSPRDTESLYHSSENFAQMTDYLNAFTPAIAQIFILGDVVHNLPSGDLTYYATTRTRFDEASDRLAALHAPVHALFGNHDYDPGVLGRRSTEGLFEQKLGMVPYLSVDYRGFRFILLDNYLGESCGDTSECGTASLGADQLAWLDRQLADRLPTFLFTHEPFGSIATQETGGRNLPDLLAAHKDHIRLLANGHMHIWMNMGSSAYGIPNWWVGSTRFSPNAVMLLELNPQGGTMRILNEACLSDLSDTNPAYDPITQTCVSAR